MFSQKGKPEDMYKKILNCTIPEKKKKYIYRQIEYFQYKKTKEKFQYEFDKFLKLIEDFYETPDSEKNKAWLEVVYEIITLNPKYKQTLFVSIMEKAISNEYNDENLQKKIILYLSNDCTVFPKESIYIPLMKKVCIYLCFKCLMMQEPDNTILIIKDFMNSYITPLANQNLIVNDLFYLTVLDLIIQICSYYCFNNIFIGIKLKKLSLENQSKRSNSLIDKKNLNFMTQENQYLNNFEYYYSILKMYLNDQNHTMFLKNAQIYKQIIYIICIFYSINRKISYDEILNLLEKNSVQCTHTILSLICEDNIIPIITLLNDEHKRKCLFFFLNEFQNKYFNEDSYSTIYENFVSQTVQLYENNFPFFKSYILIGALNIFTRLLIEKFHKDKQNFNKLLNIFLIRLEPLTKLDNGDIVFTVYKSLTTIIYKYYDDLNEHWCTIFSIVKTFNKFNENPNFSEKIQEIYESILMKIICLDLNSQTNRIFKYQIEELLNNYEIFNNVNLNLFKIHYKLRLKEQYSQNIESLLSFFLNNKSIPKEYEYCSYILNYIEQNDYLEITEKIIEHHIYNISNYFIENSSDNKDAMLSKWKEIIINSLIKTPNIEYYRIIINKLFDLENDKRYTSNSKFNLFYIKLIYNLIDKLNRLFESSKIQDILNILYSQIKEVQQNEKTNKLDYIIEIIIYLLKKIKYLYYDNKIYVITNKHLNMNEINEENDSLDFIHIDKSSIILNHHNLNDIPYATFNNELIYKLFLYVLNSNDKNLTIKESILGSLAKEAQKVFFYVNIDINLIINFIVNLNENTIKTYLNRDKFIPYVLQILHNLSGLLIYDPNNKNENELPLYIENKDMLLKTILAFCQTSIQIFINIIYSMEIEENFDKLNNQNEQNESSNVLNPIIYLKGFLDTLDSLLNYIYILNYPVKEINLLVEEILTIINNCSKAKDFKTRLILPVLNLIFNSRQFIVKYGGEDAILQIILYLINIVHPEMVSIFNKEFNDKFQVTNLKDNAILTNDKGIKTSKRKTTNKVSNSIDELREIEFYNTYSEIIIHFYMEQSKYATQIYQIFKSKLFLHDENNNQLNKKIFLFQELCKWNAYFRGVDRNDHYPLSDEDKCFKKDYLYLSLYPKIKSIYINTPTYSKILQIKVDDENNNSSQKQTDILSSCAGLKIQNLSEEDELTADDEIKVDSNNKSDINKHNSSNNEINSVDSFKDLVYILDPELNILSPAVKVSNYTIGYYNSISTSLLYLPNKPIIIRNDFLSQSLITKFSETPFPFLSNETNIASNDNVNNECPQKIELIYKNFLYQIKHTYLPSISKENKDFICIVYSENLSNFKFESFNSNIILIYLIINKISEHRFSLKIKYNDMIKEKKDILDQIKNKLSNLQINKHTVKYFDLKHNQTYFTEYINTLIIIINQVIVFSIGKNYPNSRVYDSLMINIAKMFDFFSN